MPASSCRTPGATGQPSSRQPCDDGGKKHIHQIYTLGGVVMRCAPATAENREHIHKSMITMRSTPATLCGRSYPFYLTSWYPRSVSPVCGCMCRVVVTHTIASSFLTLPCRAVRARGTAVLYIRRITCASKQTCTGWNYEKFLCIHNVYRENCFCRMTSNATSS